MTYHLNHSLHSLQIQASTSGFPGKTEHFILESHEFISLQFRGIYFHETTMKPYETSIKGTSSSQVLLGSPLRIPEGELGVSFAPKDLPKVGPEMGSMGHRRIHESFGALVRCGLV